MGALVSLGRPSPGALGPMLMGHHGQLLPSRSASQPHRVPEATPLKVKHNTASERASASATRLPHGLPRTGALPQTSSAHRTDRPTLTGQTDQRSRDRQTREAREAKWRPQEVQHLKRSKSAPTVPTSPIVSPARRWAKCPRGFGFRSKAPELHTSAFIGRPCATNLTLLSPWEQRGLCLHVKLTKINYVYLN